MYGGRGQIISDVGVSGGVARILDRYIVGGSVRYFCVSIDLKWDTQAYKHFLDKKVNKKDEYNYTDLFFCSQFPSKIFQIFLKCTNVRN
jgi:hypothetical protein